MVFDLIENTQKNIANNNIKTVNDIRNQKQFTADFSLSMHNNIALLHSFLRERFYTITPIARMDMKSQKIVEDLFSVFMNDYRLLPTDIRKQLSSQTSEQTLADSICTYIANMTDMMALDEHQKLFDSYRRF